MQSTAIVQPDRFKALCDNLQRLAHENKLDEILSIYVKEMQKNEFESLHNAIHSIALEKKWEGLQSLALHHIEADKQFHTLLVSPPLPAQRDDKHVAIPAATTAAVPVILPSAAPSLSDTLLKLIIDFKAIPHKSNLSRQSCKDLSSKLKIFSLATLCDIFLHLIRDKISPDHQFLGQCIYYLAQEKLAQHAKEIYLHLEKMGKLSSYVCQWTIYCARDRNDSIDINFAFEVFQQCINLGIETVKIYNEMIYVAALNNHLEHAQFVYGLTLKLNLADHFSHGFAVKAGANTNNIEFAIKAYNQAIKSQATSDKFFNSTIFCCSTNAKDKHWKNFMYNAYFAMVNSQSRTNVVLEAIQIIEVRARQDRDRQDVLNDIERRRREAASNNTSAYFFSPPPFVVAANPVYTAEYSSDAPLSFTKK
jgi:hypothetical protein